MSVIAEAGSFNVTAGQTTGSWNNVTLSNFSGITPAAGIFIAVYDGTDSSGNDKGYSFAVADNTTANQAGSIHFVSEDAQANSDCASRINQEAMYSFGSDFGGNMRGTVQLNSSSNLFQYNLNRSSATYGYTIRYLIIGGSTITNSKLLAWDMPQTTGDYAVTGVGFQPDAAISVFADNGLSSSQNSYSQGIAFWDGTNERIIEARARNSRPDMETWHESSNTALKLYAAAGALRSEASFGTTTNPSGWNSDGVDLNFSTVDTNANHVRTLFLKGGSYNCGDDQTPTSASTVSVNVGFTPKGVLLASHGGSHTARDAAHAQMSLGVADGSVDQGVSINDEDAAATSNVDILDSGTKSLIVQTTSGGMVDEADVAFDGNDVDVVFSTADSTQRAFFYFAIGEAAAADPVLNQTHVNQAVNRAAVF